MQDNSFDGDQYQPYPPDSNKRDLKKSFDEIDNKLKNLQSELTNISKKEPNPTFNQRTTFENRQLEPYQGYNNRDDLDYNDHPRKAFPNPFDSNTAIQKNSSTPKLQKANLDVSSYSSRGGTTPKGKSSTKPDGAVMEVKSRIRKIFQFYTSFGDRCNSTQLKSAKFHKMMLDSGVREYLTQKQLDLLFVAENKHKPNMSFEVFLNLLTKVAKTVYKNENVTDSKALDLLLKRHLLPLYESLYHETEMGIDDQKFSEEIDDHIILIFKSVHNLLFKIYQVYFPWEIQTSQQINIVKQRTENALFIFLKEFDICPALITKSTSYLIWTEVLDTPIHKLTKSLRNPSMIPYMDRDVGTLFTFAKFTAFLARAAIISYENQLGPNNRKFSNAERLALMLERMELSPGMLNFEKKTYIPHNSKTSLIVSRDILEKILISPDPLEDVQSTQRQQRVDGTINESTMKSDKRSKSEVRLHSMLQNGQERLRNTSRGRSRDNSRYGGDESVRGGGTRFEFDQEYAVEIFEKYRDNIVRVFQYYCSFGEPMNTTKLKSIKFVKLLKEAGILQSGNQTKDESTFRILENVRGYENIQNRAVTQVDADMIVVALTGSKQIKETLDRNASHDRSVKSPSIGFHNHLKKSNTPVASHGKLDYEAFLRALDMLAVKMFPEWEPAKALKHLVEKFILKLDQQITQISMETNKPVGGQPLQLLVDILKDPEIVGFLGIVHKSMLIFYNHYSDSRGLMNFERFVKFSKDFGLFPDVIAKGKITNFFYTLAAIHAQAEKTDQMESTSMTKRGKSNRAIDQTENELIDQHLFIEAIALCAFEIPYGDPQPSVVAKICYLLERMNQSNGPSIVQKEQGLTRSPTGASWDILHVIRKKYPHIFGLELPEPEDPNPFDALVKETINQKY